MQTFDVIVLGCGGVGSAALYHLAGRGVRTLGIDRFSPAHDRGSSHGQTRIIRQAYFEHPDYVPMLFRAYELWHELEERRGEQLYFPVGLVQIGPPDGEVLPGVRESARRHGLEVEELSRREMRGRFPAFRVPEPLLGTFERNAGYLLVERCVIAHLEEAVRRGAELHSTETVQRWHAAGDAIVVETDRDRYAAGRLIITAGAWAHDVLAGLGAPLEVRRKPLYWYPARGDVFRADRGCPTFLYEVPAGIFYGFPQIDELGIKVAEHTGGAVVTDPLTVDREIDPVDQSRVARFCERYLPQLSKQLIQHSVCLYTMTPDAHFVVDRHPEYPQVAFAAGLSGHGFKFAAMLGESLCQLALDGRSAVPVDFLSCKRPALVGQARGA